MIPGFLGAAGLGQLSRLLELTLARVVDVHPKENSVDVTVLRDNRRLVSVPIVGQLNSGNTGTVDLPVPDLTTGRGEDEKWQSGATDRRDVIAVIAFADGGPVCLGTILPPLTEMTFPDEIGKGRKISRHGSDVYTSTDKDGNTEWAHPSGTYIRVATDPQHEDLSGKDYDRLWKIKNNKDKAVHLHLEVANEANGQVFTLNIAPDGDTRIWAKGSITLESAKQIDLQAPKVTATNLVVV